MKRKVVVILTLAVVAISMFVPSTNANGPIPGDDWTVDDSTKTITWTGLNDASDIALGEIAQVSAPIEELEPGIHRITSTGPSAGFRWQNLTKAAGAANGTCPPADGICWAVQPDGSYLWTGASDGTVDIHQGNAASLAAIRSGAIFKFTPTITGTIIISNGYVNGVPVNTNVGVTPGECVVTSAGSSGGFRWTPDPGFGWRK